MTCTTIAGGSAPVTGGRRPARVRTGRPPDARAARPTEARRNQLLRQADAAGLSPIELAELTGSNVRTARDAQADPPLPDGLMDDAETEAMLARPVVDADGRPTGRAYGDDPIIRRWLEAHRRP